MVVIDKKSEDYVKPDNYVRSREEVIDWCREYLAKHAEEKKAIHNARTRWAIRTARRSETDEEAETALEILIDKHFGEPVSAQAAEEPVVEPEEVVEVADGGD